MREGAGVAFASMGYLYEDEVIQALAVNEAGTWYEVRLEDGRLVDGILYPRELAEGQHRDISSYGGWREYRTARAN